MNQTVRAFDKAFKRFKERGWDTLYVLLDVHETVLYPNYKGVSERFYAHSKEALQEMAKIPEIKIIMWTCSKPEDCEKYLKLFLDNGIKICYTNENPEVSGKLNWGDYSKKLYCNILLDDKSGLDAEQDWQEIHEYLKDRNKITIGDDRV